MPLPKGGGKKQVGKNIQELHKGNTYAKTAAKHGKAVADRQAIAIAESAARSKSGKRKRG